MKTCRWIWSFAVLAAALSQIGCHQETSAPAQAPKAVAEVRGSRIDSKPALTNATETPAAPLSFGTTNASETNSPVIPPTAPIVAGAVGDPPLVGFDKLASFTYDMPDETLGKPETVSTNSPNQIPKTVLALDKQRVALKGFMLPLKVEGGLVTELLLMKDQSMCCYGAVPKITEWVSVKMTTKGIKPVMDQPVTLHGQLKVGEIRENGFLVGIYAMDGEKMIGPLDM